LKYLCKTENEYEKHQGVVVSIGGLRIAARKKLDVLIFMTSNHARVNRSEIQRAFRFLDRHDRNTVGINHRCLEAGMAKQSLDDSNIVSGLQQMGDKGMAEGV
jgi:hypothetical protein